MSNTKLDLAKCKVLVVEDSETCRAQVQFVLEESGFEVTTLNGPFGFVRALLRDRPDVALVDVTMPGLRGDKLVQLALQRPDINCAIVLYSDLAEDVLRELVRESGAAGYLTKTADHKLLPAAVRRFSRGSRAP